MLSGMKVNILLLKTEMKPYAQNILQLSQGMIVLVKTGMLPSTDIKRALCINLREYSVRCNVPNWKINSEYQNMH